MKEFNKLTKLAKKGFTLMELLVTVILVAVLASYAVYSYNNTMEEAREKAAKSKLAALGGATMRFLTERGYNLTNSHLCQNGEHGDFVSDITESNINGTCDRTARINILGVFRCGYAERHLGVDDNFDFFFGCPKGHGCGSNSYAGISVYMKRKNGGNCFAYFDPDVDRVFEVN